MMNSRSLVAFSLFAFFSLTLFGCASVETTGSYNENLSEKNPYTFSYDRNVEGAVEHLKRNLLPKGFSLVNEEKYGNGGSYVFEKTLSDDEKFETTGVFEAMTGTSTGTQKGRLVFVVSRNDGNVVVEMTPRIVVTTQQDGEDDSSSETEETQVPQGHPLPIKYGGMLAKLDDWELQNPRRNQVFVNGNATATAEAQKPGEAKTESEGRRSDMSEKQSTGQDERPGEGGEDVAWVQKTLNDLGHDCGTVDGVMGPNTRSCIRDFQRSKDLSVSGRMDETTYQQVLVALRSDEEGTEEQMSRQDKRPGEGGEDVTWVQETLNDLGHDCGTVDGVMGPSTRSCIRDFQRSKDLPVSGRMDETTYRQVLAVIRSQDTEEKTTAADGPSSEKTVADESSSDEASSRSDEALSMPDGAPSKEVLRKAIIGLIEEGKVPEAVKRTMSGSCADGNVKDLTIRAVGRESKLFGKTYWPVKVFVTGSCTQAGLCGPDSIYGPCETFTFDRKKVEFGVRKDPYGNWVARALRR